MKSTHDSALTERQKKIYDFICRGASKGMCPTVREIQKKFEITSPNGVMCHIRALVKKGRIKHRGNHRGYVPARISKCPMCGSSVPCKELSA